LVQSSLSSRLKIKVTAKPRRLTAAIILRTDRTPNIAFKWQNEDADEMVGKEYEPVEKPVSKKGRGIAPLNRINITFDLAKSLNPRPPLDSLHRG
jgi:hypothetical protein